MKSFLIFFSIIFFTINTSAVEVDKYCSYGEAPIKTKQVISGSILKVNFKPTDDLESFQITNVRPSGSISVLNFEEQKIENVKINQIIKSEVEISSFSELVYVVFDITIKKDGKLTKYSIPVSLGSLSNKQKKERSKKIKIARGKGFGKKNKKGIVQPAPKDVLINEMHE
jgi:hypothetical protein